VAEVAKRAAVLADHVAQRRLASHDVPFEVGGFRVVQVEMRIRVIPSSNPDCSQRPSNAACSAVWRLFVFSFLIAL
jgi:hypothetical protein